MERYFPYSVSLKQKYGEKVYKLPIALPISCPNRDGSLGTNGCIYCAEEGAGFELLSDTLCVSVQIKQNMEYIGKNYHAKKFIAFFQNYTNTYMPTEQFKGYMEQAAKTEGIVGISVSTRPDCIHDMYLDILEEIRDTYHVDIMIELGLQSPNWHTLMIVERGHTLAEFVDAAVRIKSRGFWLAAHLILNLPWDDKIDCVESAKLMSALKVDEVKLHALYIMKNTKLGEMYENHEFEIIPLTQYIDRVITFLEYLSSNIAIGRLIGRAPEENSLFVNWGKSWWVIKAMIEKEMERRDAYQGKKCDYLNGRAVKHFVGEDVATQ